MRGSVATEQEDFCIFTSLNTALLGHPEPKNVLQSLVSICYTFLGGTFSNFPRGVIPLKKNEGDVSPSVPRDRRPCMRSKESGLIPLRV